MSAKRDLTHVRRYLLGEASEEECAAVERRYFGDDEAADRIAAAEDDLIDDYLADRLERPERARFEHVYLSNPHRRRRVETIRQLKAAATSQREPRSRTKPATSPLPSRGNGGPWRRP